MKAVLNKWTYIGRKGPHWPDIQHFIDLSPNHYEVPLIPPLSWSEELSRYIFIWQIWLGG